MILLELSPVVSRHRVALSYPVLMHFGGDSGGIFNCIIALGTRPPAPEWLARAMCLNPAASRRRGPSRRPRSARRVAELPRSPTFGLTVIPLDPLPARILELSFSSEMGAIHSDLAKRGRHVVQRRSSRIASTIMSRSRQPSHHSFFSNLSGGLSRRTASALHGPWPRIERSGATISRGYIRKNDDGPDCHVWDSARRCSAARALWPLAASAPSR